MCEYCSWLPRKNDCRNPSIEVKTLHNILMRHQYFMQCFHFNPNNICFLIIVALLPSCFSWNFFFFRSSILLSLILSSSLFFQQDIVALELARWIIFCKLNDCFSLLFSAFWGQQCRAVKRKIKSIEHDFQIERPSAVTVKPGKSYDHATVPSQCTFHFTHFLFAVLCENKWLSFVLSSNHARMRAR